MGKNLMQGLDTLGTYDEIIHLCVCIALYCGKLISIEQTYVDISRYYHHHHHHELFSCCSRSSALCTYRCKCDTHVHVRYGVHSQSSDEE